MNKHILVATDGSDAATGAVDWAAEVAEIVTVRRAGYLFLFRDRPPPGET